MYLIKKDKKVRIAISGQSGCGNTTVSTLISQKLNINLINYTFRTLASETNVTLASIIEKAKTDTTYDKIVDTKQVELARKNSCVLGSRLAIWMLPEADLKVYLFASPVVRAKRIVNREGGNISEIMKFTAMRDSEDTRRYKELYSIDNTDYSFADLIVDTETMLPEEICEKILQLLEKKGLLVRQ